MRLAVLGVTALISGLCVLPAASAAWRYGRLVTPADIMTYPEAGPSGRYSDVDRFSSGGILRDVRRATRAAFEGGGEAFVPPLREWVSGREHDMAAVLIGLLACGLMVLYRRDAAARRVTLLIAAFVAAYACAIVFAPYLFLPQRYLLYTVPVVVVTLLPPCAGAFAELLPRRFHRIMVPAAALAIPAACLVFMGSPIGTRTGLTVEVKPGDAIYFFISSLKRDALVAGFPGGIIENVPYLCRRRALLTFENHQAFHTKYIEDMRNRMNALVMAYFASDHAALQRLRQDFGVTHLIVDRNDFGQKPPTYFMPFDVAKAHTAGREGGFVVLSEHAPAVVFSQDRVSVLDLRRLEPEIPMEPGSGVDRR